MSLKFYSKILLFGEYSIIKGSKGFAIPCKKYFGVLKMATHPEKLNSNLKLNDFCDYLERSGILSKILDIKSFKTDLLEGLYFDSNIPLGHGIGSSGALCASIYQRYAFDFDRKKDYSSNDLKYLQDLMALMESYYHGTSSGLDCLISLINRPVLIHSRNELKTCDEPDLALFGHFYLLESGINRKTAPLVHKFLSDIETDNVFKKKFELFVEYNDKIIDALMDTQKETFEELFIKISRLQYLHFSKLIPDSIKSIWLEGLESRQFYVKLCGAGGGGYFLVYSPRERLTQDNLIDLE